MDITTHQLRCFLAVAHTLHFGAAARELNLSPSALSEQIKTVERRTGRALFHRTSRSVQLTPHGVQLVHLAERAVAAHDDVVAWTRSQESTELTIGLMVPGLGFRDVLARATTTMPGTRWKVKHLGFLNSYDALRDGTVDCLFTARTQGEPPREFTSHAVREEDCVLVTPAHHPLADRAAVAMAEVVGLAFIAPVSNGDRVRGWLDGYGPLDVRHHAATFDEALELCGAGLGVNVAAESVRETHAHAGVRFVPIQDGPRATTYLSHRAEDDSEVVAHFVRAALAPTDDFPGRGTEQA